LYGPIVKSRSRKVQESLAAMTKSAEEQFGGIRVTKKFAVEKIMRSRFAKAVDDIVDNQLRLVRMSSIFQAILPFFGALSLIVAIIFGGYLTIRGRITLGDFVALTLYMRMVVNPLAQIGNVINTMQRAKASLERINQLMSIRPDIREVEQAKPLAPKPMDIHIRNLSFAYPDTTVESLHDVNLTIEAGKTVGIVGKTGSGKTTLVKLLLRTYDPPEGTIWIGGMDIRGVQLDSLRNQIAYVPQDGFLFSTSIRDNIAFHNRQSSMGSIETAAQQAKVYDNIMEFPERFETRLGERGVTLSGGQRQRTSLARGFIKDSPILILDDSVSAVDAVTETEIIGNLRHGRKDKTTIIIAHRISALMHADTIVVLDEGQIVERGTHKQLLAGGGIYASLFAIQEGGAHHGHARGIQKYAR
jgi:ATP-binding cassette subfamily B protein